MERGFAALAFSVCETRNKPMRSLAFLFALVTLAGCELEARITVADGPPRRFDVTYDRGKTACVRGLTVFDLTGGTRREVWAIRRLDTSETAPCSGNVSFGVTPPNYEVVVRPAALVPGRIYEVSANGVGWHARAPVVVRGG